MPLDRRAWPHERVGDRGVARRLAEPTPCRQRDYRSPGYIMQCRPRSSRGSRARDGVRQVEARAFVDSAVPGSAQVDRSASRRPSHRQRPHGARLSSSRSRIRSLRTYPRRSEPRSKSAVAYSGSACWVSTTTPISGCDVRSSPARRIPSSVFVGGMRMSVRTRSGVASSTALRSSSRSPHATDEIDVLDPLERAHDAFAREVAVLSEQHADRPRSGEGDAAVLPSSGHLGPTGFTPTGRCG